VAQKRNKIKTREISERKIEKEEEAFRAIGWRPKRRS
jgi:hypothetical protein